MGVPRLTSMVAGAALTLVAAPPSSAFVVPPSSSVIVRPHRGIVNAASPARRAGYGGTRRAGTALQMNLADRFLRVAKANLNNLLQNFEDPEKILEQAVEDMQKDLVKVRQSYAEVSAGQKRMERQKAEAERLADNWYQRAQLALQSGDESLAREALSRRQQQLDTAGNLDQQLNTQLEALDRLRDSTQQLEAKITEARAQKDNLIARARTAKTRTQVNDMLGSITGTTSMDAFDRMQEKVEALEATAEVSGELAGTSDVSLEGQFKALEGASSVDVELAKMKGALPGSSGPRPELTTKEVESELDQLKREMGSN